MTVPSVYDRLCWPLGQLESALANGEHRRELAAYLGQSEYTNLAKLAHQAAVARPRPNSPTIYLLPGILGSQLGIPRAAGEPPDLLWLDPDDIVNGRLTELHPEHSSTLQPMGAVVYNYLALKLRLVAAGFSTVLYDYDWRRDILASGRQLAERLSADASRHLVLIGHSMGGLLARAALQHCDAAQAARIKQVIGIGAPHQGSMAAVQALRATYPVVCRLAAIDRIHDAQTLTMDVFRYFTSLYQMLPAHSAELNLFEAANWPITGATPDPAMLSSALSFRSQLAPGDERFYSIIGTGQRTVTGVERHEEQFRYEITSAGDGTVASDRATLPGATVYSLRCEHSELPRSPTVAAALVDILRTGRTRRLTAGATERTRYVVYLTDAVLRNELDRKVDWHALTVAERRRYLDHLSAPPASYRSPRRRVPMTDTMPSDTMQKL
jgi:pimeloyl-ACP methyl ester carboxylesterase